MENNNSPPVPTSPPAGGSGSSPRALVTGATGLIGTRLVAALSGPVVLGRNPDQARQVLGEEVTAFAWTPDLGPPPADAFEHVDTVFHLAGEPVGQGRWTARKKRRILESRVLGTRHLVEALAALGHRPKTLVVASAVGYYGDRGEAEVLESAPPAATFLAEVCQAWEAEAHAAEALGIRVVAARLGIVLAPDGGALARMLPAFRRGLGGALGHGRQWMPWVHVDDVIRLLLHGARSLGVRGPMNITAPAPVRNQDFTLALGQALGRGARIRVPGLALRALFGELGETLLESQRVLPGVAEETGYTFRYPEVKEALVACLGPD